MEQEPFHGLLMKLSAFYLNKGVENVKGQNPVTVSQQIIIGGGKGRLVGGQVNILNMYCNA